MALLVCLERRRAVAEGVRWGVRKVGERAVGASSGLSLSSCESWRRNELKACSAGAGRAGRVENRGRGLKPTVAASRWIRRGVGVSGGRGLGEGEKRGVRRRVRWDDGVMDLSSG